MRTTIPVWLIVLFVVSGPLCFGKTSHAPLSPKILAAKTAYIDNHGSADLADKAYDELKKWGRFDIVTDRSRADIILVLSVDEGSSTTGRVSVYHPPDDKNWGGTWSHGTTSSSSPSYTHLTVLDAGTGESLYADTKEWRSFTSATRNAIKELRKRIEEQEKDSKAGSK